MQSAHLLNTVRSNSILFKGVVTQLLGTRRGNNTPTVWQSSDTPPDMVRGSAPTAARSNSIPFKGVVRQLLGTMRTINKWQ
jgi:hypothetical protein